MNKEKITVIIPTKNEEKSIGEIIEQTKAFADEVLVVDGHSTDRTREIASEKGVKVVLDKGKGKGDGLRVGIAEAKEDIIVFIDADGSHNPEDIPRLVKPILVGEADLVVGSRIKGGSDELVGDMGRFIRMTGSNIITLIINYRWGVELTDSQNGFRAIRREVANKLGLKENIFTIEQEMVMKCLKQGFRIVEVPAHECQREFSRSRIIVWRMWPRYVWCLIKNLF
jgi:glycosyltransferase involved in cell wall biosynthesis